MIFYTVIVDVHGQENLSFKCELYFCLVCNKIYEQNQDCYERKVGQSNH